MKAWSLHGISDLRLIEMPMPEPGPGEVVLKVKACGICGSDIPRIFEKGTYRFPTVPGHEFSGEVTALGVGVDESWFGRGVVVFPLIPCMNCGSCRVGHYAQCQNYNYIGSRCDGAFAEYVRVPVWNLLPIPAGISYEVAAMTEPAAVAVHALRQAGMDIGDDVIIFGSGPIGLMVGLWAKTWGARKVMMVDIDSAKLAFARSLGFTDAFDSKSGDVQEWLRSLTEGRGVDVAVEGAGMPATLESCLFAVRPFGKIVLLGNPAGDMNLSQKAYGEIMRKQLTVSGTWNSYYTDFPKNEWKLTLDMLASQALNLESLISHRLPLAMLKDGLNMMHERSGFFCKVLAVNQ